MPSRREIQVAPSSVERQTPPSVPTQRFESEPGSYSSTWWSQWSAFSVPRPYPSPTSTNETPPSDEPQFSTPPMSTRSGLFGSTAMVRLYQPWPPAAFKEVFRAAQVAPSFVLQYMPSVP